MIPAYILNNPEYMDHIRSDPSHPLYAELTGVAPQQPTKSEYDIGKDSLWADIYDVGQTKSYNVDQNWLERLSQYGYGLMSDQDIQDAMFYNTTIGKESIAQGGLVPYGAKFLGENGEVLRPYGLEQKSQIDAAINDLKTNYKYVDDSNLYGQVQQYGKELWNTPWGGGLPEYADQGLNAYDYGNGGYVANNDLESLLKSRTGLSNFNDYIPVSEGFAKGAGALADQLWDSNYLKRLLDEPQLDDRYVDGTVVGNLLNNGFLYGVLDSTDTSGNVTQERVRKDLSDAEKNKFAALMAYGDSNLGLGSYASDPWFASTYLNRMSDYNVDEQYDRFKSSDPFFSLFGIDPNKNYVQKDDVEQVQNFYKDFYGPDSYSNQIPGILAQRAKKGPLGEFGGILGTLLSFTPLAPLGYALQLGSAVENESLLGGLGALAGLGGLGGLGGFSDATQLANQGLGFSQIADTLGYTGVGSLGANLAAGYGSVAGAGAGVLDTLGVGDALSGVSGGLSPEYINSTLGSSATMGALQGADNGNLLAGIGAGLLAPIIGHAVNTGTSAINSGLNDLTSSATGTQSTLAQQVNSALGNTVGAVANSGVQGAVKGLANSVAGNLLGNDADIGQAVLSGAVNSAAGNAFNQVATPVKEFANEQLGNIGDFASEQLSGIGDALQAAWDQITNGVNLPEYTAPDDQYISVDTAAGNNQDEQYTSVDTAAGNNPDEQYQSVASVAHEADNPYLSPDSGYLDAFLNGTPTEQFDSPVIANPDNFYDDIQQNDPDLFNWMNQPAAEQPYYAPDEQYVSVDTVANEQPYYAPDEQYVSVDTVANEQPYYAPDEQYVSVDTVANDNGFSAVPGVDSMSGTNNAATLNTGSTTPEISQSAPTEISYTDPNEGVTDMGDLDWQQAADIFDLTGGDDPYNLDGWDFSGAGLGDLFGEDLFSATPGGSSNTSNSTLLGDILAGGGALGSGALDTIINGSNTTPSTTFPNPSTGGTSTTQVTGGNTPAAGATGGLLGAIKSIFGENATAKDVIPWLLGGTAIAGALTDNKPTTTTTNVTSTPAVPDWYSQAQQDMAAKLSAMPMVSPYYTQPLAAGISQNEQSGVNMADSATGAWAPQFANAVNQATRTAMTIPETDLTQYMNPYMAEVLAPTLRGINQNFDSSMNKLNDAAASRGSFGGSRNSLLMGLNEENRARALGEETSKGFSNAFNYATDTALKDRAALLNTANSLGSMAGDYQRMLSGDVNQLMSTGAAERGIKDNLYTKQYTDFTNQLKYPLDAAGAYAGALGAVAPKVYGNSSTTTQTGPAPNFWSNLLGMGATGVSLYNQLFPNTSTTTPTATPTVAPFSNAPGSTNYGPVQPGTTTVGDASIF